MSESPIKKIHHLAILVQDIEQAAVFWRDRLGLNLQAIEEVPQEQARVAFLPVGETKIELVQPTNPDTGLGKYLEKRGGGIHHICLEVDDIAAKVDSLRDHGVEMINPTPLTRDSGTKYAFIHPKSAFGVLVELYQLT